MKILLAHDGSRYADTALQNLSQAGLPEVGDALVLCVAAEDSSAQDVIEPGTLGIDLTAKRQTEALAVAETAADRLKTFLPGWNVSGETLSGSPAAVIRETAEWFSPDLLVLGSHGRSRVTRLFLGSVSLNLLHHAACSVRVVRGGRQPGRAPLRLVIGTDGSEEAGRMVDKVAARCWPKNTEVTLVSVVETLVPAREALAASTYAHETAFAVIREVDEAERRRLREAAERAEATLSRAGLTVHTVVREGDARHAILEEASQHGADCIFVGARGLGRMERFLLGSVSTHVVTHAQCPVEVVR